MTAAAAPVTPDDVARAASRLAGVAHRTPVLTSATLDAQVGASLHLKAEHLQRVGAFKFRGAYNALAALDPEVRARGVVAFSSGNHAQAVALACRLLEVPATIVMPTDAPPVKVAATRGYGAEVVTYDRYTQDRRAIGEAVAAERGATVVPPFDHPDVVAGQGTAARELLEDVPDLDLLVAPIGGGGLLAGTTLAAAAHDGDVEVVGVEPADRRAARDALAGGEVVEVPVARTVLDGQQTTHLGDVPFGVLREHGVRVVGVDDDAALDTVRWMAVHAKQVLEPSGAAALAAIRSGAIDVRGRRVGVLLSGGNVAPELLARTLSSVEPFSGAGSHAG
ncbi:pyridoxal-phosphate dependent enzyme [Nitriliruptoraceae bacterium ZYF776]|nr:pyridoxal-phosphate dependent enzyme [Profundirhabdus halotolerans]